MPATYEPIASTTVSGSAVATITFTSIPQTYTDLIIVVAGQGSGTTDVYTKMGNGSIDSGSNYSATTLYGANNQALSARFSNSSNGMWTGYPQLGTGGLWTLTASLMSYANTNVFKTMLSAHTENANAVYRTVGLWRSTSAVNQLQLFMGAAAIGVGTVVSLYGIKAA